MEPVGGMDQIAAAFADKLRRKVHYRATVEQIEIGPDEVVVHYRNARTRRHQTLVADYCVSNLPLPILSRVPANLSPSFRDAVEALEFTPACKVVWQANERFWETDGAEIYGGISFIEDIIQQVWYPSAGFLQPKGILTGAYNYRENARVFARLSLPERLAVARQAATKLHAEFADTALVPDAKALSIAWANVEH